MLSIPRPNTYVVAEIDIDRTLRNIGDLEVKEEVQSIQPLQCLMYLNMVSVVESSHVACLP